MATMIPKIMQDDNYSYGEKQVFEALKTKLGSEYYVFHSVRWNDVYSSKKTIWGESDFTIFHPLKGIIVIEVKSGGIEYDGDCWSYIRTDNHRKYPMKNPLKQADKSKYRFIELLEELFEENKYSSKMKCQIEPAVWFPSILKREDIGRMPIEFNEKIVLLESALEDPEKYIDQIYDYYNMKQLTYLTAECSEMIVNAFAPHFRAVASLKSKRKEQKNLFFRLTEEQNALINYLEEQKVAAIQGAAGTGKTILACEKAKSLANSGKVLFLCYNKFLRNVLQEEKEIDPKKYENIDFYNIHQLVAYKIKSANVNDDDIEVFLSNYENYDWEYKHIIVDEAQDFKDIFIEKLYEIAFFSEGSFYVFFDKNQFVQGKDFPKWLRDAECRLILNINCRNTYRIAKTSGKPIGVEPKTLKSIKGDNAKLYICKDIKSVEKRLLSQIKIYHDNGYPLDEICIITTKTTENSIIKDLKMVGCYEIVEERQKGKIFFTSSRKFKGLESDAIILIDIDENTFNNDENTRLFYVGASRAKISLDLIVNGDENTISAIANQLNLELKKKPIAALIKTLELKYNPEE